MGLSNYRDINKVLVAILVITIKGPFLHLRSPMNLQVEIMSTQYMWIEFHTPETENKASPCSPAYKRQYKPNLGNRQASAAEQLCTYAKLENQGYTVTGSARQVLAFGGWGV